MHANTAKDEPIDAVITWVDGQDEAHIAKLHQYLLKEGIQRPVEAAPTRYNQCNEIEYCVKSLLRFAPWIRTIFIVTDAQIPPIIDELQDTPFAEKVKIIDHREIFSGLEQCLPSFNSLSIESVLWRIPNLAERFIYCNDDFFLIKPVQSTDFFREDKLIVRGVWKVPRDQKYLSRLKKYLSMYVSSIKHPYKLDAHRALQEKSAALAGFEYTFFHLPHCPLSLKKSLFEDFFRENPLMLEKNAAFPIRNKEQFWTMSLVQHLEIKNKHAIFDNRLQTIYIEGDRYSEDKIYSRIKRAEKNSNAAFMCLQSLDTASITIRDFLFTWLRNRINWKHPL